MDTTDLKLISFACMSMVAIIIIVTVVKPEWSIAYQQGVAITHKDAFKRGFMTKEIDKDDKVIYRWIEEHKLSNYEK